MKENIYKDLYDNHIKKYEELLEKNIITEYELNNIKENICRKEQLSQEEIYTSERKNITDKIEKLSLKEIVLETMKLVLNIFKLIIYFIVYLFILLPTVMLEPYGIHTILFIVVAILLLPFIQNKIVKRNTKIKKSFITFISIFMYIILIIWCALNLPTTETNNSEKNTNISQTEITEDKKLVEIEKLNFTNYQDNIISFIENSKCNECFKVKAFVPFDNITELSISYDVIDKNLSAEEYDKYFKEEITRVFEYLKNKRIIDNRFVKDDDDLNKIEISFSVYYNPTNKMADNEIIGLVSINYNMNSGFIESYNNIINTTIITKEELNNVKK